MYTNLPDLFNSIQKFSMILPSFWCTEEIQIVALPLSGLTFRIWRPNEHTSVNKYHETACNLGQAYVF